MASAAIPPTQNAPVSGNSAAPSAEGSAHLDWFWADRKGGVMVSPSRNGDEIGDPWVMHRHAISAPPTYHQ